MADETGSAAPPTQMASSSGPSAAGSSFVALPSGLVIRHYVIEEVIGAGGFGITYRAHHERLTSKIFALKEFFPRQFASRQGTQVYSTADGDGLFRWGLDRFLKEAEALAKCEHPGIVHVVDYFEENGTAYAVLGYVEGLQLGQWLDALGRAPTQAELDRILMPLLDALEVVHGARLLHRDIAPDNVLIRRDGSPCLIDFGACREDIRDRSRKVSAIVKHGYSPPEQYHGIAELQGPWTDIYAIAATLYRAVSGAPPVDSSRRGALGDDLRPAAEMATVDYRPEFLAAIDKALRLKPDERPQSVAEWRRMLLADRSGAATPASAVRDARQEPRPTGTSEIGIADPEPPAGGDRASVRPPGKRSRKGAAIAAIAALALLAAGALAVLRAPTSTSPVQPDPETAAATAWRPLADSTDIPAIERYLARYGATAAAEPARSRLADLRQRLRRKEDADRNWLACRDAPDSAKEAACAAVIHSDDASDRRAAALRLVGTAARSAGNYDKAIADYTRALDLATDAQVLTDRGIAHFLKGGTDGRAAAMRDYDAAIRLDPRHAEALNNRAWSLFQSGRTTEALADASASIEANPANGYAYDTRGHILEALGRRDDAIRDYERAVAIDATQEASRTALQRLRASNR